MARSVTIKSITRRAGVTYVTVGKTQWEIPGGLPELKDWVRARVSEADADFLAALVLAVWLARDPTAANPGQVEGRTARLDLQAGNVSAVGALLRIV